MSSAGVAPAVSLRATEEERNPSQGWRSHWVVRVGVPALYLLATVVAVDRVGLPYSQDWIFVWIIGLLLSFSIGAGQHSARRLVKDWLPILGVLLAYDLLRGIADGNVFPVHWQSPISADNALGFGEVPTVRLQDAIYTPGHLHFWDYAAFSFWFSHFFATLLVAACIWLFAYRWFHRFAACIVVLAVLGLITYVLFPAAPPWLAGQQDYLPHVYRINHAVVSNLPIPKAGALFQQGTNWANDVAAVPSLHAAYTMLIALFLWPRLDRRWRPLLIAYPIGMGLSLIYLGEHYLIDILLGWAYAAATILIVNWGAEKLAERRRRPAPAAPASAARPVGASR
jgi:membrane-associated phospholipid phosphatase